MQDYVDFYKNSLLERLKSDPPIWLALVLQQGGLSSTL